MALENNQIENSNIDNDEISLKELIIKIMDFAVFLKSKWKLFFLAGVIGGLIGFTFAFFEKPTYKAVLTFAMDEDKGGGGGGGGLSGALGLANSFGIDLGSGGGGAFAASNLAELMKSRFIVEKVLLKPIAINHKVVSLAEFYIQINGLRKNWNKIQKLKEIQFYIFWFFLLKKTKNISINFLHQYAYILLNTYINSVLIIIRVSN